MQEVTSMPTMVTQHDIEFLLDLFAEAHGLSFRQVLTSIEGTYIKEISPVYQIFSKFPGVPTPL